MKNNITQSKSTGKKHIPGPITLKRYSDLFMQSISYWAPSTPIVQPIQTKPNSSLRFACIVEDRLYHGLRHEGELLLLTPHNWEEVIKYGKPDMLIMESVWETVTGHWKLGQLESSEDRSKLIKIVEIANHLNIPTVFWFTKGHEYHEHYKDFLKFFDFVFCADPKEIEILQKEGIKAEVLLPCVQPILYNPFRFFDHYDDFCLEVLYDGWGDLDNFQDQLTILSKIKDHGLSIIDSHNLIFEIHKNKLTEYQNNILGCVDTKSRILALKYSKLCISFDVTRLTSTERSWMTVESAACRVPQIHHGKVDEDNICKEILIERPNDMEFLVEIARLKEDEIYRTRLAQLSWRKVLLHHTYANRLQRICDKTQIKYDGNQFPLISMITPTYRKSYIPRIIDNFEKQTYPNKELIIVLNGNEPISNEEVLIIRDDVQIHSVPTELFTGGCMNLGISAAKGTYSFKVDDDDHYGPNYILDMILHTHAIDMDFFGKPLSRYVHFESDDTVCQTRHFKGKPLSIIPWHHSSFDSPHLFTGNSISGKTENFRIYDFKDNGYRCSDTSFFLNSDIHIQKCLVGIVDDFNMVVERRSDIATHTWQISEEKLKSHSNDRTCSFDDRMV